MVLGTGEGDREIKGKGVKKERKIRGRRRVKR